MGFWNKVWKGVKSIGTGISKGVDFVVDRAKDVGSILNKGVDYAKKGWSAIKSIPVIGQIAEEAIPKLVESIPLVGPYIKDVPKYVDKINQGINLVDSLNKNIKRGDLNGIGSDVRDIVRTMPIPAMQQYF